MWFHDSNGSGSYDYYIEKLCAPPTEPKTFFELSIRCTACRIEGGSALHPPLSVLLEGEHILPGPGHRLTLYLWHSVGNYFAVIELLKTLLAKQNILIFYQI